MHEVGESFADASAFARGLAAGPARASLAAMEQMYGAGLDARSHGEAFLALFQSRLVPNGLYLLDEPEAALSPQSQLALIALIAETVADNCQFILATHSPSCSRTRMRRSTRSTAYRSSACVTESCSTSTSRGIS
jgi:predicted ATPase